MKHKILLPLLICLTLSCFSSEMPHISIEDKQQKLSIQDCIRRKAISCILYGTPVALEKNRGELDKVLTYFKQNGLIDQLLYLVDFRGYPGLLHAMIKNRMANESLKNGLQMFADFDGNLREWLNGDDQTVYFLVLGHEELIKEQHVMTSADNIINNLQ